MTRSIALMIGISFSIVSLAEPTYMTDSEMKEMQTTCNNLAHHVMFAAKMRDSGVLLPEFMEKINREVKDEFYKKQLISMTEWVYQATEFIPQTTKLHTFGVCTLSASGIMNEENAHKLRDDALYCQNHFPSDPEKLDFCIDKKISEIFQREMKKFLKSKKS